MSDSNNPLTADELLTMSSVARCELVRGEIRERAFEGFSHGVVSSQLSYVLTRCIKENDLGVTFAAGTGFQLANDPDTVRAPTFAFVSKGRIQSTGIQERYFPGAPDLAVEVVSPNDSLEEVEEKVYEYLAAGASMVWIVNPRRRSVTSYRAGHQPIVLRESDLLDGSDVVIGFSCKVSDLFPS